MKTKFFLLIGIFTLALTACGGDDNGDDPTKPLDNATISFTKMANCPDAEVDQAIVWKGAIYYVNRTSFLRYTPAKTSGKASHPLPPPTCSYGRINYIASITAAINRFMFMPIQLTLGK